MSSPEPRRSRLGVTAASAGTRPDDYVLHPLPALDGVLIYVTMSGEHVGTYFGATELAASAAVAAALSDRIEATR